MDKQQYRLTPEHREQLKPWADKWIANAMSTQKMTAEDREVCRAAVTGLYKAAKLEPPRNTVFVSSPFVLAFAGGFSAATWWASKNQPQAAEVVVSNVAQHSVRLRMFGLRDALLGSIAEGVSPDVRSVLGFRDLSPTHWQLGVHAECASRDAADGAVRNSNDAASCPKIYDAVDKVGLRPPLPPTDDETWMEVSRALSAVLQFTVTIANTHLNIPGVIGDGDAEKATEGARVPQPVSFDRRAALADLLCITQLLNAYRLRANVDGLMNELHVGAHAAALGAWGADENETVRLSDDTASYPKVYDRVDTDSSVEISARLERVTSEAVIQLNSMVYDTREAAYGSLKDAQEVMENAHRGRPRLDVEEATYTHDRESLRRSLRELTGVLERVMEPISRARLDVVEAALRDANPNLAVAPGESVTGGTSFRRSGYEGASSLAADDGTVRAQVVEATRQAIAGAVERPADGRRPRVDEIAPKRPNASAAIAVTGVMHESQSPRHRTWPWDRLDALLITLVTSTTLTTAASQMTRSRSNSSVPDAVREMQEGQHEATQQEWAKEASGAVPAAPNNSVKESIVRLRHSLWNLSNVVEHLTLLDVSRALDHVFNADTDSDSAETFAEVTAGEMEVRGATGQLERMWHSAVDRSNMDAVRFAVNAHTLILLDELLNTSPFAAEPAAATPGSMAGAQAALDDLSRGSKHVAAATPHTLPDDTFETTSGPFLKKVHAGVSTADVSEVAMSMWDQAITALEEMITSVKHSIESQKREPDLSNWYVVGDDMAKLARELGVGDFGLRCATLTWKMWQGGNQWSGGDSFFSFFRHVAKLDIDYTDWDHWEKLSLHSGPRVLHPQFCMISDRPEVLLVDDRNRPHCDTGPFCRWRDGSALYAVHGVRVPAWIIEKPERLTAKHIDDERNAEVRRVMIERFTPKRWLRESGAKVVAEAPADHSHIGLRTARLLRKEVPDDEPILMLDLLNSTPEPDGTVKRYFLRVDPNAYGGKAAKNLQAAAASTWRLPDGSLAFERYTDYAPEMES